MAKETIEVPGGLVEFPDNSVWAVTGQRSGPAEEEEKHGIDS
jgi:hypothetical protein